MKILIVSDAWHPQLNGVVRTYEYIIPELVKDGHECRVIGPGDFPWRMPMPGYAEIKLTLFARRRLRRMIADYAPDALHIATEGPLGLAARAVAEKEKIPYSTCYHTQFPDYMERRVRKHFPPLAGLSHAWSVKLITWFHAHSQNVMVATQSLEDELRGWGFTAPMARLTRGVDRNVFYPGDKNLFADLKKPVALYVGRIAIEKSIEDFLAMDWHGSKVVVGHGPDLSALKTKYPGVIFTGKKTGTDLADHYRSADVFVFPSRTDTFGMVLIEAMASGLPLAGYNVIGPKDIITRPELGAVGDDLAAAAREALRHGTAADRVREVAEKYTWEEAARQFLAAAR